VSTTYTQQTTTTSDPASTTSHHISSGAPQRANDNLVFKPWSAIPAIEKRLGGLAQLIAIQMARRTDKNGNVAITLERIAEIVKCSDETVRRAMVEIIASNLVERRRTRDGYVYQWSTDTYSGGGVVSVLDKRCFPNTGHRMWETVTPEVVCDELEKLYRHQRSEKYGVPQDLPLNADYCVLSRKTRAIVGPNILFAARKRQGEPAEALEQTLLLVCKKFLAMAGNDDFLKKSGHPLEELGRQNGRDLARILEDVLKTKPYRPETAEQLEQVEASRPHTHERVKVVGAMPRFEFVAPQQAAKPKPVVRESSVEVTPEIRTVLHAISKAPNLADISDNPGFAKELLTIAAEKGHGLPEVLRALPAVNAAARGQQGSTRILGAALRAFVNFVAA